MLPFETEPGDFSKPCPFWQPRKERSCHGLFPWLQLFFLQQSLPGTAEPLEKQGSVRWQLGCRCGWCDRCGWWEVAPGEKGSKPPRLQAELTFITLPFLPSSLEAERGPLPSLHREEQARTPFLLQGEDKLRSGGGAAPSVTEGGHVLAMQPGTASLSLGTQPGPDFLKGQPALVFLKRWRR